MQRESFLMQPLSIQDDRAVNVVGSTQLPSIKRAGFVSGIRQRLIQKMIWVNILMVAIKQAKKLSMGIAHAKKLKQLRNQYRPQQNITKYQNIAGKYYPNYNCPGWPSSAFNRYIRHLINKQLVNAPVTLHTLIFAITKKCGFRCEHCCEWENLNQPENLRREDLLLIINRFYESGISQLHLSGGEPFNRLNDIIFLLEHLPKDIDCWIYTTGYQMTLEKAKILKRKGLTGISISLDDHNPAQHDRFRGKPGSFQRAIKACHDANTAGLAVTFTICATKNFITEENLVAYADLAKTQGASFIQILEPKPVGHYAGTDVALKQTHIQLLESFYEKMNFDKNFTSYPTVVYHGYYSRRLGCAGSGKDYLYVDTDGDVHSCPFCQRKLFSALTGDLSENIAKMRSSGCGLFSRHNPIVKPIVHPMIEIV